MTQLQSTLIWIIAVLSILGMLIRPRRISEAYWACGGALLLVVTGLLPLRQAGHAIYEGLDVFLFLAGMMILAELAREEGVFDWIANMAAAHASGSPQRLFALVYVSGIVVTALLSNDATAVVLTPAVLAVVRRAKAEPKPYLFACALIANAASFVFPVSNLHCTLGHLYRDYLCVSAVAFSKPIARHHPSPHAWREIDDGRKTGSC